MFLVDSEGSSVLLWYRTWSRGNTQWYCLPA